MSQAVLGIDVSKKTLDAALIVGDKTLSKQFKNSADGFALLAAWLKSMRVAEVHACLEATGSYSEAVALFLHAQGHRVSIVNPLRIKGFAQSSLRRNKTDWLDARLIAEFCRTQKPAQWLPPVPAVRQLQALVRRLETIAEMRQAEDNRLANAPREVQASITRMIGLLDAEIKELEQQIKNHINNNPELKEQSELLQTIPGIGARTASLLLSEIEFERFESARQIAAHAGVVPLRAAIGNKPQAIGFVEVRQRANSAGVVLSGNRRQAAQPSYQRIC